jgi:hypothetical protein
LFIAFSVKEKVKHEFSGIGMFHVLRQNVRLAPIDVGHCDYLLLSVFAWKEGTNLSRRNCVLTLFLKETIGKARRAIKSQLLYWVRMLLRDAWL